MLGISAPPVHVPLLRGPPGADLRRIAPPVPGTWMSFVDRPGRVRLLTALSCYILVGLSAAYFAVIAVFPAVLYVIWQACGAGGSGFRDWLREKWAWLFLFAALSVPALFVLFANQLWAVAHGSR